MKKVLFLAIAALAYVGIANAQPTAGTLSTQSDITLFTDGAINTAIYASPATEATVRTTTGGSYSFKVTTTDWNTELNLVSPDVFTNYILGSTMKVTSGSGVGALAETSKSSKVTTTVTYAPVPATTASPDKLTFTETAYDLAGTAMCTAVNEVVNITILPKQDVTVTLNKKAFCESDLATVYPQIDIKWKNTLKSQFNLAITGPSGFTFTTADYKTTTAADVSGWSLGGLTWATSPVAGQYKFTVSNVLDEVGAEATTVADVYGTVTYAATGQTFIIMPSPKPTLTTSTIK